MVSALLLATAVSLGALTYNPKERTRPFDEPSYEEAYAWERTSGDEEPMIWCAKSQIATHSIPSYSDNGSTDDKPNGAMTVDSSSGHIEGTLHLNSKSDQILHGLGERDEDYFCFQTREQLRYDFKISNPSNYHFEICRSLATACSWALEANQAFIEIPRFYTVHKVVVRKTKYTTNYQWVLESSYASKFSYQESVKHTDKVIRNVVKHPATQVAYTGSIHLLYADDAMDKFLQERSVSEDERNA